MAIESLPTFTKPARQRWESIPADIRQRLLSNVWCGGRTDALDKALPVFAFPKSSGLRLWVLPFCLRERTLAIPQGAPFAANFNCASNAAVQGRVVEPQKSPESALT